MHRVLVLYPAPKDPAHFKKYYEETHLPLAHADAGTDFEPVQLRDRGRGRAFTVFLRF